MGGGGEGLGGGAGRVFLLVLLWVLVSVLAACSASEQLTALLRYTLSVQLCFV